MGGIVVKKDIISYDRNGFIIHGRRVFLIGGEFHYFRVPAEQWEDRLQKMKSLGANLISVYVPWSIHEPYEGKERWSGDYDLDRFLSLCEAYGLYVLIKPGPYVCAELDFGGHPDWLIGKIARKEFRLRMLDKGYLDLCYRWYRMVNEKIQPHLITKGGNIIAIQIENEYDHLIEYGEETITKEDAINYFMFLKKAMEELDIDVPKFANEAAFLRGRDIIDTRTYYPNIPGLWFNEYDLFEGKIIESRKSQSTCPVMILELQAGWFAQIGVPIYEPDLNVVEGVSKSVFIHGASIMNYYMMVGGTTFPFMGARGDIVFLGGLGNITSYDFGGAPIREWGELHAEKYYWLKGFIRFAKEFANMILFGDDKKYVSITGGGENIAVLGPKGAELDYALNKSYENFTVYEQGNSDGRFFMIRNLENEDKNLTVKVSGELNGKEYEFRTNVLANETRMLPVNFRIPGTDLVLGYSTSEVICSKEYPKGIAFIMAGKRKVAGEMVINALKADISIIKGDVEVYGSGDSSLLRYTHSDINIIKVKNAYLFIIENELVGRFEELSSCILFHSSYYMKNIEENDGAIVLDMQIRENSDNLFRIFPMDDFKRDFLNVEDYDIALSRDEKTGMWHAGFKTGTLHGKPQFIWTSDWRYEADSAEVAEDYDHSGWLKLDKPVSLEEAGLIRHGYYWYRTKFELEKEPGMIFMDYIHNDTDRMFIYINEKLAYKSHNKKIKQRDITRFLRKGENTMAILYANEFHNKSHPHEGDIVKFSGIMNPFELYGTYADNEKMSLSVSSFYVKQGLEGINKGYHKLNYDDASWNRVPLAEKYVVAPEMGHIVWFRRTFKYDIGDEFSAPICFIPGIADQRLTFYINGKPVGRYDILGPQQEFYVPEAYLIKGTENLISIILECPAFYDELQDGFRRGFMTDPKFRQIFVAKNVIIKIV